MAMSIRSPEPVHPVTSPQPRPASEDGMVLKGDGGNLAETALLWNGCQLEANATGVIKSNDRCGWLNYRSRPGDCSSAYWCALQKDLLYIFRSPEDPALCGAILLRGMVVEPTDDLDGDCWILMKATHATKRWDAYIQAKSVQDRQQWLFALSQHACREPFEAQSVKRDDHAANLYGYNELFKAEVKWRMMKEINNAAHNTSDNYEGRKSLLSSSLLNQPAMAKVQRRASIEADRSDKEGDTEKEVDVSIHGSLEEGFSRERCESHTDRLLSSDSFHSETLKKIAREENRFLLSLLEDDSPTLKKELTRLEVRIEHLQENMKKLAEVTSRYLRSSLQSISCGRELAGTLVRVSPPSDGDGALTGFECGVRKLVHCFRSHLTLEEVRLTQLQQSFFYDLRRLLDVEIKEAKGCKHRLERARERYDASMSSYLQLPKETECQRAKEAEEELQALHKALEVVKVDAVLMLQEIDSKKNLEYLDHLTTWMYQQRAFFYTGYNLMQANDSYLAAVSKNLRQTRSTIAEKKRKAVQAFEDSRTVPPPPSRVRSWTKPFDDSGWMHKEGFLLKRSSNLRKDWKKRWFILDGSGAGTLSYRSERTSKDDLDDDTVKELPLTLATVRIPRDIGKRFCFELISLKPPRTLLLQANSQVDMEEWVCTIQNNIGVSLGVNPQGTAASLSRGPIGACNTIAQVRSASGNGFCADCGSPEPDWISLNLLIVICIQCAGIHRGLGVHLSKTRSMTLDALEPLDLSLLLSVGNEKANAIWEAEWESSRTPAKVTPDSGKREREEWIKAKYEKRAFVERDKGDKSKLLRSSCAAGDLLGTYRSIAHGEEVHGTQTGGHGLRTPLHEAAEGGFPLVCNLLLLSGCSADAVDSEGDTPLHLAAKSRREEVVELLLSKRADPMVKNRQGLTASEIASRLESAVLERNPSLAKLAKVKTEARTKTVPLVAPAPPCASSKPSKKEVVTALFDFSGTEEEDLSFLAGGKILVMAKDVSGWWEGECNGVRGLFPANYTDA